MIRFLGRLLRGLLVLGLFGWAVWSAWPMLEAARRRFDPRGEASAALTRLSNAKSSAVYVLDPQRWVEFSIPNQDPRIKIVSNANLAPNAATQPDSEWLYALHYQVVDSSDRVLQEATYHHRAAVSWYQPPTASEPLTAAFYADSPLVPADGRLLMINFTGTTGAARLRLRLEHSVPGIESVVVRVYAREHLFDPPIDHRWQRIARHQRQALAEASVYGLDLLRADEQIHLLRQRWSPVGPVGIEGQDYHGQRLYSTLDIETEPLRTPIPPAGLYVDRDLRATLPIPDPKAWISLEFLETDQTVAGSVSGPATDPAPTEVALFWYGYQPRQRAVYRVPLNGKPTTLWPEKIGGGLLEVVAPRPLILRATRYQPNEPPLDLLPEPLYLRLYRLEAARPLEFAIVHPDAKPTLWRVDLRLAAPEPAAAATVRYEFLGGRGEVLRQGTLTVTGSVSLYDRLSGQQALIERVSEPTTYGFALPATIARVRLTTTASVLANAYTRPPDLRREVRVPEHYRPADQERPRQQPVWFSVLPLAAASWIQESRTALLVLQSRPPQRDAEILAGRYDWQDYYPDGDWRGRYLLNPRDPEAPLREQSLSVVFQPLATGAPARVNLQGPPGRLTVDPSLLMLRDSDRPDPVRISVDGQLVYTGVLTLRRDQLRLPPLPMGVRTVQVQSASPARWFMNHSGGGPGSLIRRLAYRLDQQPLEFVYAKTTPAIEILSGMLQIPANGNRRVRLRAQVAMPDAAILGPFTHPTPREWLYDIQADTTYPVPVLDTPTEQVGLGQRFFLPLGDDAPPGNYRVRLWLEEGNGYLTLYRVTPGLPLGYELFTEDTQP